MSQQRRAAMYRRSLLLTGASRNVFYFTAGRWGVLTLTLALT